MNVRNKPHRLKYFDYSSDGMYFITTKTQNWTQSFGKIVVESEDIILTEAGKILENEWLKTPSIRPNVKLGKHKIMPDHFHGIIIIGNPVLPEYISPELQHLYVPFTPNFKTKFGPQHKTLGRIVGGIKAACSRQIHADVNPDFHWEKSFYDEVIRDLASVRRVEIYMDNNVIEWKRKKRIS